MACKSGNSSNLSKHLAKIHHTLAERCAALNCPSETSSTAIVSIGLYASSTHVEHVSKVLFIKDKYRTLK